jgi:hypothetical protein
MIEISRTTTGWLFHDVPTSRKLKVPLRYRNRSVHFQGFEFLLFGQTVSHQGLSAFIRMGRRAVLTKDGVFLTRG